jgi:hypothetical protein
VLILCGRQHQPATATDLVNTLMGILPKSAVDD